MATKSPEQFEVGDILARNDRTPYSNSPVVSVEKYNSNQTKVAFQNGEVVEFFNGIQFELKE